MNTGGGKQGGGIEPGEWVLEARRGEWSTEAGQGGEGPSSQELTQGVLTPLPVSEA